MAITRAEVKQIVLNALAMYKDLMDTANANKFPTKAEVQTQIDAIEGTDLSDVESKLEVLETDVEGLKIFQAEAGGDIDNLKGEVTELKDDPNTDVEEITYADVAALFND